MRTPRAVVLLLVALTLAVVFIFAFSAIPLENSALALDWSVFWQATHAFKLDYSSGLVFTPPWGLVMLWPISWLPLTAGWGLLSLASLGVLVASASYSSLGRQRLLVALLLGLSYPAIRQIADGNIELLVIAGSLLLLCALPRQRPWLFAFGFLLCSAKIQESWLLLASAAWLAWRQWPRRYFWRMSAAVALPVVLLLGWRGAAWLQAMQQFPFAGTPIDASLQAVAGRAGLPSGALEMWVGVGLCALWVMRHASRNNLQPLSAGALLAAGLLLAPYAASNSVLTPLALAGSALLVARPVVGLLVFAAAYVPYLLMGNVEWRLMHESDYWAAVLLLILGLSLIVMRVTRDVSANR